LRRLAPALVALAVVALIASGTSVARGDNPIPIVEPLGRGSFPADVSGQLKTEVGHRTLVSHFKDASDAVFAKITIPVGAEAPLHTHSGPALILNVGPGTLTSAITDGCVTAEYPPGTAFLDPGEGVAHVAVNNSGADVVLYAIFLAVEAGPVIPTDSHADCNL
jgi:hypothetical protein